MPDQARASHAQHVRNIRAQLVLRKLRSMSVKELQQFIVVHITQCDTCTREKPCDVAAKLVAYTERRMQMEKVAQAIPRQRTYNTRGQIARINALQGRAGLRDIAREAIKKYQKGEGTDDDAG